MQNQTAQNPLDAALRRLEALHACAMARRRGDKVIPFPIARPRQVTQR